jgi:hypothetical protein
LALGARIALPCQSLAHRRAHTMKADVLALIVMALLLGLLLTLAVFGY